MACAELCTATRFAFSPSSGTRMERAAYIPQGCCPGPKQAGVSMCHKTNGETRKKAHRRRDAGEAVPRVAVRQAREAVIQRAAVILRRGARRVGEGRPAVRRVLRRARRDVAPRGRAQRGAGGAWRPRVVAQVPPRRHRQRAAGHRARRSRVDAAQAAGLRCGSKLRFVSISQPNWPARETPLADSCWRLNLDLNRIYPTHCMRRAVTDIW